MRKGYGVVLLLAFLVGGIFWGSVAFGLTADEILDTMKEREARFETQRIQGTMLLTDSKGKNETREVIMYSKDEGDDTTSMVIRFLSPAEVKNVTLLNLKSGEKMYLYMPAFKKVRLIAGSGKKEKFAGTSFSYEDFGQNYDREEYESTLLGEDEANYQLELRPKDPDSDYSKLVMLVDKEKFYFKKVDFFDKDGNLWKTLEVLKVEERQDGTIRLLGIAFSDLKEETKTVFTMEKIEENISLPSDFFSVRTIQKPSL
ncbi:MAG: outer membrane lipoprotein-sorting protein [Atribacterota bacterium]